MGPLSNDNPYCGKTITITCTATGKTTTAVVVDKCMGCTGYAIDLSNAAFDELDSEAVGRTPGTWYFNN
jgi:rare lipoprotein A (peptidoglycan hydrolase)